MLVRHFSDIGPAFWQRYAAENLQANIAPHQRRDPCDFEHVGDERGDGRLAVGAGDAKDLVRRQVALGFGEEFDVADDGNLGFARVRGDRVAVARPAGRDDDARETDKVDTRGRTSVRESGGRYVKYVVAAEALKK